MKGRLARIAFTAVLVSCGSDERRPAQDLIDREKDPEARRELEAIRDSVEREMREREAALDREIERLRKENAELREKAAR